MKMFVKKEGYFLSVCMDRIILIVLGIKPDNTGLCINDTESSETGELKVVFYAANGGVKM